MVSYSWSKCRQKGFAVERRSGICRWGVHDIAERHSVPDDGSLSVAQGPYLSKGAGFALAAPRGRADQATPPWQPTLSQREELSALRFVFPLNVAGQEREDRFDVELARKIEPCLFDHSLPVGGVIIALVSGSQTEQLFQRCPLCFPCWRAHREAVRDLPSDYALESSEEALASRSQIPPETACKPSALLHYLSPVDAPVQFFV